MGSALEGRPWTSYRESARVQMYRSASITLLVCEQGHVHFVPLTPALCVSNSAQRARMEDRGLSPDSLYFLSGMTHQRSRQLKEI